MIDGYFLFQFLLRVDGVFDVTATATIVTIEQGTLNGTYLKARNGRMFNAFYGIPYAEPPVGNLRFKVNQLSISTLGKLGRRRKVLTWLLIC